MLPARAAQGCLPPSTCFALNLHGSLPSVGHVLKSASSLEEESPPLLCWKLRTHLMKPGLEAAHSPGEGLGDVYRGGAHEDRLARSIEMALTTKDEFGQVMTPKERFRQLCYE
eukprot:1160484-Pelagomonas_calceolata.AAC.3